VTARVTDWGLAALVAVLLATGALTLFAGAPGSAWIIAVHDGCGIAIALLVAVKLRRVWPRLARSARNVDRRAAGIVAATAVIGCVLAGLLWSAGLAVAPAGYSLLSWHDALGAILAFAVIAHMVVRAKRLRRRDLAGRRQLLATTGLAAAALVAWRGQTPFEALLALKGARRRFTGSYEAGSFAGNAFPSTSWVADHPAPVDPVAYRLRVEGLTARPLRLTLDELAGADELVATLDCTGGFYSTQRWRGVRLGRLLDLAGTDPGARHVSIASVTGYRWSFAIDDARSLLLATHVGGAPLDHDHGAPIRLVVAGARGFEWVKWVTRIELRRDPDLGAPLSTLWSSFV
jgi:DMSO/TMAO reductase YedYZ molybdopterin-dependent catalytic subunit